MLFRSMGSSMKGEIKKNERNAKIGEIACLLADMNDEQIHNMHTYAVDEYREPNHEAVALSAIVELSRRKKTEQKAAAKESVRG